MKIGETTANIIQTHDVAYNSITIFNSDRSCMILQFRTNLKLKGT